MRLALLLFLALPACATLSELLPAPQPAAPAARPAPERPVVTAETRLVLFPYGQYTASNEKGSATLDLNADQSYTLSWQVPLTGKQGQWSGSFEWLKNAAGFEILAYFDTRVAENGALTGALIVDKREALSQLDFERHAFAVSVPDLGVVRFTPKQ